MCVITGNNLALNSILELSKSFNSLHCCRICLISKNELQKQVQKNISMIRSITNYEVNVFGIQENCIFNTIPNFHVTKNFSVDPMYDILEGICRYDIGKILNNLINENKFLTLEIFHERIRFFKKLPLVKIFI